MAFEFAKLSRSAQRAAFAHMSKGSAAEKAVPVQGAAERMSRPKTAAHKIAQASSVRKSQQLSAGYVAGRGASDSDVQTLISNYRLMHGRDPSPAQVAKIRRARKS